jgi:hypothetical protein
MLEIGGRRWLIADPQSSLAEFIHTFIAPYRALGKGEGLQSHRLFICSPDFLRLAGLEYISFELGAEVRMGHKLF